MTENRSSEPALESWKAIAAHLKRDVRTAKRWEAAEGLPVRRHLHQARSSVYAYPSELDAWWAGRAPRLMADGEVIGRRPLLPRLGLVAALLFTLATSRSGPAGVVRASVQQTGPTLTEIFAGSDAFDKTGPARVSPDGKWLAATQNGRLVVIELSSENSRALTEGSFAPPAFGFAGSPSWSPDGTQIGYGWFVDNHWELRVVARAGGQPRLVTSRFNPLDWSPDGRQFVGWRARTLALATIDGTVTELRTWDGRVHTPWGRAVFSPDGRSVAYDVTAGGKSRVYVIDLASKTETPITLPPTSDRLPTWSPDGRTLLFVSDRGGRPDLWAVAVRDSKPAGDARVVYAEIGDLRSVSGWDGADRLVFSRQTSWGDLYRVTVDPSSGVLVGAPERPIREFEGKHMQAAWTSDGKRLAMLAQTRDRGAVYIRVDGSSEMRELDTGDLGWLHIAGWSASGDGVVVSATLGTEFRAALIRLAGGVPETLYADRQVNFNSAKLSPDATRLVVATDSSNTIRFVDLGRRRILRDVKLQPGDAAGSFSWAPDGRAVYAAVDRRVLRIPVSPGEPQEMVNQAFQYVAVSPNGRTLALIRTVGTQPGLYVVSSSGGAPKRVSLPDEHNPSRVAWTPDGAVAYISSRRNGQMFRLGGFLSRTE